MIVHEYSTLGKGWVMVRWHWVLNYSPCLLASRLARTEANRINGLSVKLKNGNKL